MQANAPKTFRHGKIKRPSPLMPTNSMTTNFHWVSSLTTAVLAATIAAGSGIYVAWYNASEQRKVEREKMDSSMILQALNGSPDQAAHNLEFLLSTKLLTSVEHEGRIQGYLSSRISGTGASLRYIDPCSYGGCVDATPPHVPRVNGPTAPGGQR